jgi:hypothetical protein
MQDIAPFSRWHDYYKPSEDKQSPFFGATHNDFAYTQRIYNYYIHPHWDDFGAENLFVKLLFVDYEDGYAILEFIGEWNDCIDNDIATLKEQVVNQLIKNGIYKYILLCENVLNFHSSDDCYYEAWYEDIRDDEGWVCFVNTYKHVAEEMQGARLQHYVNFGAYLNGIHWRPQKPNLVFEMVEARLLGGVKQLGM